MSAIRPRHVVVVASLAAALGSTGCALLTKDAPIEPKYFSPEAPDGTLGSSSHPAAAPAMAQGLALRMGRIGSDSYLKERIVHRDGPHELGFYEERRWTERPEIYLQRALERALFEERGLRRSLSGAAPTLTADLIEFEEERGPVPGVRVRVSYALHDDRVVLREQTFTIARPVDGAGTGPRAPIDRVAAALGDALSEAVLRIADQVVTDLASSSAARPASPADGDARGESR